MFNLGRGVLPEAREFEKGVKLMRYDIVKGGSSCSLCLCEKIGASKPDSDWTAHTTNSGGEPTTKRQWFQFWIDKLKILVLVILLPNPVCFLSDFVSGHFGCS